jgi:hypothetical protein
MERFLDQNQVVLDRSSGLMWTQNAALDPFPMTWSEALDRIEALNQTTLYGYSDWKLPNRRELFSLVSHTTANPCLPPDHPFIDIFNGYYWTSTSCARLPNQAWYIHLGGARVFKGMKHGSYMVWPVRDAGSQIRPTGQRLCYDSQGSRADCRRSGQDGQFQAGIRIAAPRFRENNDIVYDSATGLTWSRQADPIKGQVDWQTALAEIEGMNARNRFGFNDWRLPTIAELESLTDMSMHSPALPAGSPFNQIQAFYWSSTTSMIDSTYAWVLYLQDGAVGVGYKPLAEFYLWPVRGNRSR